MRPKAIRRLAIVGVVILGVGLLVIGAIGLRHWQVRRGLETKRSEGLAQHAAGEHSRAVSSLADYLSRSGREDPEAWLAFARSRRLVEQPGGQHLRQALQNMRSYRQARPDDREAARELAEMYLLAGQLAEARQLCQEERPAELSEAGEGDRAFLVMEAKARLGLSDSDELAELLLERASELAPNDFETHLIRVGLMLQRGRTVEAVEHAAAVASANAGDARFAVLAAVAGDPAMTSGGVVPGEATQRRVFEIIGLDETVPAIAEARRLDDELFVGQLMRFLLQCRRSDLISVVLERAVRDLPGRDASVAYVRRLWMTGQVDALRAQGPGLVERLRARGVGAADVLGYLRLAEHTAGTLAGGLEATSTELRELGDGFRSAAWARFFEGVKLAGESKHLEAYQAFEAALNEYRQEPTFLLWRGDALASLGRPEDAIASWRGARDGSVGGVSVPATRRIVAMLQSTGRITEAVQDAELAASLGPREPGTGIMLLTARVAAVDAGLGTPADARALLSAIDESLAQTADPEQRERARVEVLGLRIPLMLRAGLREEATAEVAALSGRLGQLPAEQAEGIVRAALRAGLELDESTAGVLRGEARRTPGAALAQALRLWEAGERDAAKALVVPPEGAAGDDLLAWEIARVQLPDLTATTDVEALATLPAWTELRQKHPQSVRVLEAYVRSNAARQQPETIEQAVNELATLSGATGRAEPIFARIARASALGFRQGRTQRDWIRAEELLTKVVADAPMLLAGRVMLANLYLIDDPAAKIAPNLQKAIVHLEAASKLTGVEQSQVLLAQSAQQYQEIRDFNRARDTVFQMLGQPGESDVAALMGARLLVEQGDHELAQRVLMPVIPRLEGPDRAGAMVLLGRAFEGQADDLMAATQYERALEAGLPSAETVFTAAVFFGRTSRDAERDRALAQLDTLDLAPGQAAMTRAEVFDRLGQADAAGRAYDEALASLAEDVEAYLRVARFYARAGQPEKSAEVARAGVAKFPGSVQLKMLAQLAPGSEQGTEQLAAILDQDPGSSREAAALRRLQELEASGGLADQARLEQLAAEFADVLVVQLVVGQRLMSPPLEANAAAADLMMRAAELFPTNPRPLQLAIEAFGRVGDARRQLDAAELWRRREPTSARSADLVAAEALLTLGRAPAAVDRLQPHVDALKLTTAEGRGLLAQPFEQRLAESYATALFVARGPDAASSFLEPALGTVPGVVEMWMRIGAERTTTAATLGAWLGRVGERADTSTPRGAAQVIEVVSRFVGRVPGEGPAALAILGDLSRFDAMSVSDPLLLTSLAGLDEARGGLAQAAGDVESARSLFESSESRYLAASKLVPENPLPILRAAAAAERAGAYDRAADAYSRVVQMDGRVDAAIVAVARNNGAFCLLQTEKTAASLERALVMSREATKQSRRPEFLSTLGEVLVAQAALMPPDPRDSGGGLKGPQAVKLDEAEPLLRGALERAPEALSTMAALADLLVMRARGDKLGVEWAEAAGLVSRARAAAARAQRESGATLDPATRDRLDALAKVLEIDG